MGTVFLLVVCVRCILWHPKSKQQFVSDNFNLMENIVPAIVEKEAEKFLTNFFSLSLLEYINLHYIDSRQSKPA